MYFSFIASAATFSSMSLSLIQFHSAWIHQTAKRVKLRYMKNMKQLRFAKPYKIIHSAISPQKKHSAIKTSSSNHAWYLIFLFSSMATNRNYARTLGYCTNPNEYFHMVIYIQNQISYCGNFL